MAIKELTQDIALRQIAEEQSPQFVPGISVAPPQPPNQQQPPVPALPGLLQAGTSGFKIPTFDEAEFNTLVEDLRQTPFVQKFNQPINTALARFLADYHAGQSPGTTYETLKDGTAPILDMFPEFAEIPLSQRDPLSDNEIIGLLSKDKSGRPIGEGTISKALRYEALPIATGALGFKQGMQVGNTLVSNVPPTNIPGAVVRVGVPVLSGIGGMLLYDFLGRTANEALTEERPPMLPKTKTPYYATQILLGTGIYGPMGGLIPQNVNLGSTLAFQVLEEGVKTPWATRAIAGLEKALGKTGEYYRTQPGKAATVEGVSGAAVATTVAPLMDFAPEEQLLQLGTGIVAGTSAAGLTNFTLSVIGPGLKFARDGFAKGYQLATSPEARSEFVTKTTDLSEKIGGSVKRRRELEISKFLNKVLLAFEEDPKEAARLLENLDDGGYLIDPNTKERINLDAGTLIGSPALVAIRKAVEKYSGKALDREDVSKAELSLVNAVRLMLASGDPRAAQEASVVAKFIFQAEMDKDLQTALNQYKSAYERLTKNQDDPEEIDRLGNKIFDLLSTKLEQYRSTERRLWQAVGEDAKITTFKDEAGNQTNIPRFIQVYRSRMAGLAPEAQARVERAIPDVAAYVKRVENELGIAPGTSATVTSTADPLARFNFGKEIKRTNKKLMLGVEKDQPIDLPEGFRVFQRSEEVPGVAGKVTTTSVVDPNGNRIDITRDPSNRLFPYQAEYIDGIGPTTRGEGSSDLLSSSNLAEAVEQVAARLRSGDIKFSRKPVDEAVEGATESADDVAGIVPSELASMYTVASEDGKTLLASSQAGPGKSSKSIASMLFAMSRAMIDDLDNVPTGRNPQYDIARSYTRALNENFVRTFGGKLLNVRPTSERLYSPEEIIKEYMKADGAYLRQKQIENFAKFEIEQDLTNLLDDELRDSGRKVLARIREATFDDNRNVIDLDKLRRFYVTEKENLADFPEAKRAIESALQTGTDYRSLFDLAIRQFKRQEGAINPDGTVSQAALKKWLERPRTQALFNFFPELKRDFQDLSKAKELLDDTSKVNQRLQKRLNENFAVYSLLPDNNQRPSQKISDALADSEQTPWQNLNSLFEAVNNAPAQWSSIADPSDPASFKQVFTKEQAMDGFRSMLFESAMKSAGVNGDGIPNATRLYTRLFQPLPNVSGANADLTLAKWMISKGLVDEDTMRKSQNILKKVVEIENLAFAGKEADLEGFLNQLPAHAKVIAAALGSKAGTSIQKMLPGDDGTASLILAGRGATEGVALLERLQKHVPEGFKMDMLETLLFDAEGLARVLRLTKPKGNNAGYFDAIFNYLVRGGIAIPQRAIPLYQATEEVEEVPKAKPQPAPEPQASVQAPQQNLMAQRFAQPTPTQVQPRPAAPAPVQPPMAAPAPPQGSANPQQRQQLAAMFPNDPILGAAGGIGSLFS